MNHEQLRIEELKSKLALAQDDLSIRTAELERVESERDALKAKLNEPTKTEVDAEDWLKATSVELCRVADHFIALRNDAERVDAAAVELMDSTAKLEQENAELRARVKRLEDELNDNGLVLQKLQDERDKAISMVDRLGKALEFGVGLNRAKELMGDNHIGETTELVKRTKDAPCPDCYGGHLKPCNICGDSGVALLVIEQKESKP